MRIAVVLGADAHYGRYVPVTVQSILENSSPENQYDIIIFDCGILKNDIAQLEKQIASRENFSLIFKNVAELFARIGYRIRNQKLMKSPAMLAPIFIPQLCPEYERAVYVDTDMIINRDIAELAAVDLGDHYIAAVMDASNEVKRLLRAGETEENFYINSGLVVFNIQAWRDNNLTEKAVTYLTEGKNKEFFDQAAINFVCKGHIAKLDMTWNNLLGCRRLFYIYGGKPKLKNSPCFPRIRGQWLAAYHTKECVYHWTGKAKPWISLQIPFADIWWYYAAKTDNYRQFFAAAQKVRLFREKTRLQKFYGIPVMRVRAFLNAKKYYLFGMRHGHIAEWRVNTTSGKKSFYFLGLKLWQTNSSLPINAPAKQVT